AGMSAGDAGGPGATRAAVAALARRAARSPSQAIASGSSRPAGIDPSAMPGSKPRVLVADEPANQAMTSAAAASEQTAPARRPRRGHRNSNPPSPTSAAGPVATNRN